MFDGRLYPSGLRSLLDVCRGRQSGLDHRLRSVHAQGEGGRATERLL